MPVSDSQREAMRNIWAAVQSKSPPADHPLEQLNESDRAYITRICGSDFRPPEFGNADVLRLASWRYFQDVGFSQSEAAVAVGMMFNFVGRDDT
ncbi:MAG: hypothetical protein H0U23_15775 [Blastocatellia bacterium]|nr:hypothetical protein [Blastocatellia bacterium]